MDAEGGLGLGLSIGTQSCVTVGFLVEGTVCGGTTQGEATIGAHMEHESQRLTDLKDDENAHGMTVLWSYSTSTEPEV